MLQWDLVTAEREVLTQIKLGLGGSGWKESYLTFQPEFEAIFDARARELGVRVFMDTTAVKLEQEETGARLFVQSSSNPTPEPSVIHASFILGADGAGSFVRRACGIEQTDLGFKPTISSSSTSNITIQTGIFHSSLRSTRCWTSTVPCWPDAGVATAGLALSSMPKKVRAANTLRAWTPVGSSWRVGYLSRRRKDHSSLRLFLREQACESVATRSSAAGGRCRAHDASVHGAVPVLRHSRLA